MSATPQTDVTVGEVRGRTVAVCGGATGGNSTRLRPSIDSSIEPDHVITWHHSGRPSGAPRTVAAASALWSRERCHSGPIPAITMARQTVVTGTQEQHHRHGQSQSKLRLSERRAGHRRLCCSLAEDAGFEPARVLTPNTISNRAP